MNVRIHEPTWESPAYSLDSPVQNRGSSLRNPAACSHSGPDLSDGTGWTSELRPGNGSWPLTRSSSLIWIKSEWNVMAAQQEHSGLAPPTLHPKGFSVWNLLLCGFCMFSVCVHGFRPGPLASSMYWPESLQFTEWILEKIPEQFHSWIVQNVQAQVQKFQVGGVWHQR